MLSLAVIIMATILSLVKAGPTVDQPFDTFSKASTVLLFSPSAQDFDRFVEEGLLDGSSFTDAPPELRNRLLAVVGFFSDGIKCIPGIFLGPLQAVQGGERYPTWIAFDHVQDKVLKRLIISLKIILPFCKADEDR